MYNLFSTYFNSKLFIRSDLIQKKLWNQIELEDALHWLSTLGGAYSNLGDHSNEFVRFLKKRILYCTHEF